MYVAGVGANGGKCWHSGLGVMCFFLLVWVTGVVLLSVGLNQKSSYAEYDPYVDFVPVNTGCRIVSVSYKASQRQDNHPYCVDVYTYNFTLADEPSGPFLLSGADEKSHQKGTKCSKSSPLPASLTADTVVSCWQPAAGVSVTHLESFYSCGNAECIKVLDPSSEYDDKLSTATLLVVLGAIFLPLGVVACCVIGLFTWMAGMREEGLCGGGRSCPHRDPLRALESGHYKTADVAPSGSIVGPI